MPPAARRKATREEHRARMQHAERLLFKEGWMPAQAVRALAAEYNIGAPQAHRYCKAVRALYAQAADADPATSVPELIALLRARAAQAISGPDPDYKASVKALELEARIRGLLDRKSTVDVNISATVQHVAALDGLSPEALEALARFHQLAARDREADAPQIVGAAGELPVQASHTDE